MSITDHPFEKKVRAKLRRHGVAGTLQFAWFALLDRVFRLKILRALRVELADPAFFACPAPYRAGFLTRPALENLARDPSTEISPLFLENALRAGDQCHAILDGGELASYGWYSTRPTPLGATGFRLRFARSDIYMYKGFTAPRHRGRRLYPIGMTHALRYYRAKGYAALVCYVEATNLASLNACRRMGYRVFGSIYVLRIFGRHFALASPGCRRHAFGLARRKRAAVAIAARPAR